MKKSKNQNSNPQTIVGLHFTIDNYEVTTLEKLNEDVYSSVYTCVDSSGAIHILRIIQSKDKDIIVSIISGIVIHSKLSNHYNILRIEGYVTLEQSIQVLLEFCDGSLMSEMKHAMNTGFSNEKIAEIFSSVLAAVRFIHSQNPPIIHRGINPKNILRQKGVWKLCNFRCATTRVYHTDNENDRNLASDDIPRNTNPCYRAPEMVDLYRGEVIDIKSDIWSLGCLLFRICTLKEAFPEGKSLQILNGRYQWNQSWPVDEYFKNIVTRCLNPNPKDRPTAAMLDDEIRNHFHLNPTPDPSEKAVRMTDPIHYSSSHVEHAPIPSTMNTYTSRMNIPPQFGNPLIFSMHQSQPRPHHSHHIKLEYDSYTRALLRIPPPYDEPISDESDVEVIEETKIENQNKLDDNLTESVEKFEKEMSEIKLGDEEEEETQPQQEQQPRKRKHRPSVVQLTTTIENLIEFGDEPTELIQNTVSEFDVKGGNNDDDDDDDDKNTLINFTNTQPIQNSANNANNDLLNLMGNNFSNDNSNSNIFKSMNMSISNDSVDSNNITNTNNNIFNSTVKNSNNNDNNDLLGISSNSGSNENNSLNTNNNNNASNAFNSTNATNNNSNNIINNNSNPFNSGGLSNNMFSSNEQIFAAFDNYNKTKTIRNDLLSLDMNNNNDASTSSSTTSSSQQIGMVNKDSFSTGNINKMETFNSMLDTTNSIDDLFKNAQPIDTTDYNELYRSNPDQLKLSLLRLDNLSLATALYRFMSSDECSLFILGLARDSGIKGTRILANIPALSPTSLNLYLEQRKQFAINFPMFEGNFSLFDFTQKNKGKPPPTPGVPPVSIDVTKHLIKDLELFLNALADNQKAMVLAEDGYDAYQTLSYVIAKLRFFNIQKGFVSSSTIPLYNNLHRRISDAFTRAQLNINFPQQPFNFDDEMIIKKLRAPKHRDLFEQL